MIFFRKLKLKLGASTVTTIRIFKLCDGVTHMKLITKTDPQNTDVIRVSVRSAPALALDDCCVPYKNEPQLRNGPILAYLETLIQWPSLFCRLQSKLKKIARL